MTRVLFLKPRVDSRNLYVAKVTRWKNTRWSPATATSCYCSESRPRSTTRRPRWLFVNTAFWVRPPNSLSTSPTNLWPSCFRTKDTTSGYPTPEATLTRGDTSRSTRRIRNSGCSRTYIRYIYSLREIELWSRHQIGYVTYWGCNLKLEVYREFPWAKEKDTSMERRYRSPSIIAPRVRLQHFFGPIGIRYYMSKNEKMAYIEPRLNANVLVFPKRVTQMGRHRVQGLAGLYRLHSRNDWSN